MVYGWGSKQFPRYNTFYEMKGVGMPPGDPFGIHDSCHLMRLIIRNKNISGLYMTYLKQQEYIWFMGGDLNSFRDKTHL